MGIGYAWSIGQLSQGLTGPTSGISVSTGGTYTLFYSQGFSMLYLAVSYVTSSTMTLALILNPTTGTFTYPTYTLTFVLTPPSTAAYAVYSYFGAVSLTNQSLTNATATTISLYYAGGSASIPSLTSAKYIVQTITLVYTTSSSSYIGFTTVQPYY